MAGTNFNIGVNDNDVVSRLDRIINKVESMGQVSKTVGKELYEALGTLKDTGSIQKAWEALDSVIKENSKSISTLTEEVKEYRRLSKEAEGNLNFKEAREYEKMANASERLLGFRKEMSNALDETNQKLADQAQKLENAENKQKSFRTELMETTNEYRQMVRAMQNGEAVDPQKLEEVKKKWIELKGAMRQMNAETSILNSANPALTATIHAIQGVTGAFSVAQGVMGLFNSKSEEMQKIMLRVQSLMSVMMGLQQIQNTLLAKNAIVTNTLGKLKEWWIRTTKKAAVATTAETAALGGLAKAFKTLSIAIKSIPGIGWLITAATALVAVIRSLNKESEKTGKMFEDLFKTAADGAAAATAQIRELKEQWDKLQFAGDIFKKDFLNDAITKIKKLGYAVRDLAQAEEILSDPAKVQAFEEAILRRAQAEAARELIIEYTKKRVEALAINQTMASVTKGAGISAYIPFTKQWKAARKQNQTYEEVQEYDQILATLASFRDSAQTISTEILNTLGLGLVGESVSGSTNGAAKRKSPEEIAKEYNAYLDSVDKALKQSREKRYAELRNEATESMAEGLEKELKKIEDETLEASLNAGNWLEQQYEKGFAALRKKYKDLYGSDYEGEMFDRSNSNWAKLVDDWSENVGTAIDAEMVELNKQIDKQEENRRKKAFEQEAANMLKGLTMREEYEKQKLEITKKYEKLIADELAKGNKEEAERLKNQGKDEIDDLTLKYNKEQAELFQSTTNRSRASLNEQLGKLKDRLKVLQETNGSLEEMKDIQEKLDAVQDALDEKEQASAKSIKEIVMTYAKALGMRQKAKQLEEEAAKATERGDTKLAEQREARAKRLKETADSLTEGLGSKWQMAITAVVEGFQLAAQYAQKIAEITGDTQLTDWAEQASAFAQNLNAAWEGYQATGNWYGAVAGGLADMFTQTMNAKIEAKMWVKEFERAIKNFRSAIELAGVTFDSDKFQDMFGVRTLESATDAYRKMNDALRLYNERVTAAFTLGERQKTNKNTGLGVFLNHDLLGLPTIGFSAFSKKTTQKWYSELDAYQRGLNQLQSMQVQVKRANGWQKFWGKQSQYKSLYDVAPELWDENGDFNVENAQRFLQVSKQLTDEQRDQIQNAIDLKKAYDDAKQALEDIIADTVGSFADDMADAVWEAITKGANAWDIFREKGNEALVALGKQMLKEFAISTYLEQFKDKLREAYGSGDMSNIANIYTEIFDGIPMVLENMTIAGENWVRMLKENGYDVTAAGATSGSTGGYTTQMSHEDASEINGRMTDIQMQIRLIQGNIVQIVSLQQETRGFARMQADYLYDIRRYTATLPTIAEYSKKIATNTANL